MAFRNRCECNRSRSALLDFDDASVKVPDRMDAPRSSCDGCPIFSTAQLNCSRCVERAPSPHGEAPKNLVLYGLMKGGIVIPDHVFEEVLRYLYSDQSGCAGNPIFCVGLSPRYRHLNDEFRCR